jgi:hypothetical protein
MDTNMTRLKEDLEFLTNLVRKLNFGFGMEKIPKKKKSQNRKRKPAKYKKSDNNE